MPREKKPKPMTPETRAYRRRKELSGGTAPRLASQVDMTKPRPAFAENGGHPPNKHPDGTSR